jgi:hypothetical protein
MNPKELGTLALICLLGALLWLALMIAGMASAGPLDTFEQVVAHVSKLGALFYAAYLNAAFLVTIPAILFMTALGRYCRSVSRSAVSLGAAFIPIYGMLNLVCYLSQVVVVPMLVELRQVEGQRALSDALLRVMIHQWPYSGVAFFNALAYGLLGIPSIIFGVAMTRHREPEKLGGILLALSGVAGILSVVGMLLHSKALSFAVVIGGVLYVLALVPLAHHFLQGCRQGRLLASS